MNTSALRNEPIQERSKATLNKIIDAAKAHLAEVGRDRFTTEGVSTQAAVSIGTIYRYFEDRVAILDVIFPDRDKAVEALAEIRGIVAEDYAVDYTVDLIKSVLAESAA